MEINSIDDLMDNQLNNLSGLPFEKILSWHEKLTRWLGKVNSYRAESLCYSGRPEGLILGKSRLVNSRFARTFVSPPRFASFESFFNAFGQSILFNLKHLHVCYVSLDKPGEASAFNSTVNSIGQLEQLGIFHAGLDYQDRRHITIVLKLKLAMLNSIQMEDLGAIKMTLDAPRLRRVSLAYCDDLVLELVHGESVETLLIDNVDYTEVKNLKNLKYLFCRELTAIDQRFLSGLERLNKLREVHLAEEPKTGREVIEMLFEQKKKPGRHHLKIYLSGLLLNGPSDPEIDTLLTLKGYLDCLIKNRTRLADQILNFVQLNYSGIESNADLDLATKILIKFIDLDQICVDKPVQNVQRFLNLLKSFGQIVKLDFPCSQPQNLFDLLPEYCAVQTLVIDNQPEDLRFLFKLKHLMFLEINWSIDAKFIRSVFKECKFVSEVKFRYTKKEVKIRVHYPKRFEVSFDGPTTSASDAFDDLDDVIDLIRSETNPMNAKAAVQKRKTEAGSGPRSSKKRPTL